MLQQPCSAAGDGALLWALSVALPLGDCLVSRWFQNDVRFSLKYKGGISVDWF